MQEILLNILFLVTPILGLGFPVIAIIAVNRLSYLYHNKTNKAGFEFKRRTYSPSYKDTLKNLELTEDDFHKGKG